MSPCIASSPLVGGPGLPILPVGAVAATRLTPARSAVIPGPVRRGGRWLVLGALVAVLLAAIWGCGGDNLGPLEGVPVGLPAVGAPFPYPRFLASNGKVVDVTAGTSGRRVMLVFMRGFDGIVCPYCTRQTAELVKRADELHGANADVYIVYPGPADTVPLFVEAVNQRMRIDKASDLPIPLLLDVDLRAVKSLGILGDLSLPSTFILEPDGRVVFTYVGKDMRDRPALDAVLVALRSPSVVPPPPPVPAVPTSTTATTTATTISEIPASPDPVAPPTAPPTDTDPLPPPAPESPAFATPDDHG